MNPIIVDLETTGLDPDRHGIASIGAKKSCNGAEFYIECRIRDDAEIDPGALAVNGFTEAQVRDPKKPTEWEAFAEFLRFCGWSDRENVHRLLLAGMNVGSFDFLFLKRVANADVDDHFAAKVFAHRTIDLHSVAIHHATQAGLAIPPTGFSTDAIYDLLGLPPEPKPHHALTGARCEFAAFQILFQRR